jgi:hypothetical protein
MSNGHAEKSPPDQAHVLAQLREEVRRRRARLQLSEPDNPHARSLAELRRSVDALNDLWFVSAHIPITSRSLPGKVGALTKRVVRILLRWYINPIVEQQNRFNSAATRAIGELVAYQEMMAREWLLLEQRIGELEVGYKAQAQGEQESDAATR